MAQTNRASNGKRSIKTVSVLGVAGASLAASATASSAEMPVPSTGYQGPHFGVEELSDVTLATFHVINPDQPGAAHAWHPPSRMRRSLRRSLAAVTAAVTAAAMVAVAAMDVAGAVAAAAAAAVAASPGAVARPSAKRQASRLCIRERRVWSMRPDPLLSVFRCPDSSAILLFGRTVARVEIGAKAVTPVVAFMA